MRDWQNTQDYFKKGFQRLDARSSVRIYDKFDTPEVDISNIYRTQNLQKFMVWAERSGQLIFSLMLIVFNSVLIAVCFVLVAQEKQNGQLGDCYGSNNDLIPRFSDEYVS